MDCVVSHREMVGRRGRVEVERALRERTYYGRRAGNQEPVSSMADSKSSPRPLLYGADPTPAEHYRYMRGYFDQPPVELEEIMLLHHRLLLRGGDAYDRYKDWRLDVDDMTYEELLELGDKIGHVSTGLREEEIECSIRKAKHSIFEKLLSSSEMDRKCSICQEEYETEDEVGKLSCGHSYHIYCITKWLLQKNACPVCKTAVSKT